MRFFQKLKQLLGKTDVQMEWEWIENPFLFDEPMIKATILVKAGKNTIILNGITGIFVAKYTNADGKEEEIELGREVQVINEFHHTTRNGKSVPVYPCSINAGDEEKFGYFIGNLNLKKSLSEWAVNDSVSANRQGVKFFFIGEVAIKVKFFLFNPTLEQEIKVI